MVGAQEVRLVFNKEHSHEDHCWSRGPKSGPEVFSVFLAVDVGRKSYFSKKFMGKGEEAQTPIQMLPHLENDAGEKISYDLVMQLKMQPIEGDNTLEGKEEDLKFYTDSLYIDQMRGGVNTGGRMTRKRTIHDLRKVARVRQSEWWARIFDELIFMYLSGARGINPDYIYSTAYRGLCDERLRRAGQPAHPLRQRGDVQGHARGDGQDGSEVHRPCRGARRHDGRRHDDDPGAPALRDRRRGALRPAAAPLGAEFDCAPTRHGPVAGHPEGGSAAEGAPARSSRARSGCTTTSSCTSTAG
jgi:hypothetical protein